MIAKTWGLCLGPKMGGSWEKEQITDLENPGPLPTVTSQVLRTQIGQGEGLLNRQAVLASFGHQLVFLSGPWRMNSLA